MKDLTGHFSLTTLGRTEDCTDTPICAIPVWGARPHERPEHFSISEKAKSSGTKPSGTPTVPPKKNEPSDAERQSRQLGGNGLPPTRINGRPGSFPMPQA